MIKIIYESIMQAFSSLVGNKLRSFLSLLGITIGIFCIIAVLSAVDSLKSSIKDGLGELGSDVVVIDVMPWNEDPNQNYWKYMKRPSPDHDDYLALKDKLKLAENMAYSVFLNGRTIKYKSSNVQGAFIMSTTYDFPEVQNINIERGRYFTPKEYQKGANKVIIGSKIAESLFGSIEPLGKFVKLFGQKFQIIGILKPEGENPFNFIDYDEVTWISYTTGKRFINYKGKNMQKMLYAKAQEGAGNEALKDEITGALRNIRRLRPKEENNFALNEISMLDQILDKIFGVLYFAGFLIGIFAMVVGMFSVANIMFVSVKERTNIIGIKKALGAKNGIILLEFLIESVILCIIGGLLGLLMVIVVLALISMFIPFEMTTAPIFIVVGLVTSVLVGIIAGIIPAYLASRLDPVEAIRQ